MTYNEIASVAYAVNLFQMHVLNRKVKLRFACPLNLPSALTSVVVVNVKRSEWTVWIKPRLQFRFSTASIASRIFLVIKPNNLHTLINMCDVKMWLYH